MIAPDGDGGKGFLSPYASQYNGKLVAAYRRVKFAVAQGATFRTAGITLSLMGS
jgi:hypothetical protein